MPEPIDTVLASEMTPAARRRLRVRASILDAAERMIADAGEDGFSIRRLAEEIDYSPAAIYKYFGSKDELVDELKEAFFGRILTHIDRVQGSQEPFSHRAHHCLRVYIEEALEKPHQYLGAFSGIVDPDDAIQNESNKARAFDYLISMVEEGQARGQFDPARDTVVVAKSVWACCHGAASLLAHLPHFLESMKTESPVERDAFLDLHADIILNGLYKR
ncbi:MAG: TetR/AcrR family transcriptional regulator [Pseudomonadota bacterium]